MLTSVVMLFAIILLGRIIPYAKQVRWLENSLQAHYRAEWSLEQAKYEFMKTSARNNLDTLPPRIHIEDDSTLSVAHPVLNTGHLSDFVVISQNTKLPLQIRLYDQDTDPTWFGTSKKNPQFHTMYRYGGGMLFDLTERNTMNPLFNMIAHTDEENKTKIWNIRAEFVYSSWRGNIQFFGTATNATTPTIFDGIKINEAKDKNREAGRDTLAYIMNLENCSFASCALKLYLTGWSLTSIPTSFETSIPIPDLNAVIIADWISDQGDYHARSIELIPTVQSI